MRTQTELDVAREVRRILVKHWIDLGRLSIRYHGGRLMLHGLLQRIDGVADPLSPPIVEGMFYRIKQLKEVRSVSAHFENWTDTGGMWRPVEGYAPGKAAGPLSVPAPREGDPAHSYTMTVKGGTA